MAMQTRALADFLPLLAPNAPAVPGPVAEQALRLAAVEFCERTRCWRHITERTLRRAESCLVAPEYAAIFEIESATFDGVLLEATQFSNFEQGAAETSPAQPRYVTQSGPDTVTVFPFQEGQLILSLFLKPRSGTDGYTPSNYDDDIDEPGNQVPDFLFVQHAEAIVAGALDRVLNIPGQTYTNPARAAEYKALFERAVNGHFARNLRGQHRAPTRVRPNHF